MIWHRVVIPAGSTGVLLTLEFPSLCQLVKWVGDGTTGKWQYLKINQTWVVPGVMLSVELFSDAFLLLFAL